MEQTTLTFEFIGGDAPIIYTRNLPVNDVKKSGFCSDMIEAFGQVPEQGFTITITNKIPQDLHELIVNNIINILHFLTTSNGDDFIDNTHIVSNDYNNEEFDKIIGSDIRTIAHMLTILSFMNISSAHKYMCNIIGRFIKTKHYGKLKAI